MKKFSRLDTAITLFAVIVVWLSVYRLGKAFAEACLRVIRDFSR